VAYVTPDMDLLLMDKHDMDMHASDMDLTRIRILATLAVATERVSLLVIMITLR
jgi:hypothetical protein